MWMRDGLNKLDWIKQYRSLHGTTLAEAKNAFESGRPFRDAAPAQKTESWRDHQNTILFAHATGQISHIYQGSCPDKDSPGARDPACAVCRALDASLPAEQKPAAWRPKLAHPIPYVTGAPTQSDIDHWKSQGAELEYAYAGPQPVLDIGDSAQIAIEWLVDYCRRPAPGDDHLPHLRTLLDCIRRAAGVRG